MSIFQRLGKIVESNLNFSDKKTSHNIFDINDFDDDDELKHIIYELNNSHENFDYTKNNNDFSADKNTKIPHEVQVAFNIIGAPSNSSTEEIKAQFKSKIKKFHPDMAMNKSEDEQRIAKQKAAEILTAYNTIKNYRKF